MTELKLSMYYAPNAGRKNLTALTSAHVAKLILRKDANGIVTATAVNFLYEGKTENVFVAKEVVLSAGYVW